MNDVDQVISDLEQNTRLLDGKYRLLYQGVLHLIQRQNDLLQQIKETQEKQQKQIDAMQEQLTRLRTLFERFSTIDQQTQQNTEAIARIRGMIWTVAILTPPVAAIIEGFVAALGPRPFG